MAVTQFNKVFLGHTPSDQRKYITAVFRHLKEKFPKIVIPAAGQFTLAKCAIEAGYEKQNIFNSDISLYSSLLGYLYAGKPVESLGYKVSEMYQPIYDQAKTDFEKVAVLIWIMKLQQLNPTVFYEQVVYDDLIHNAPKHIKSIKQKLEDFDVYYHGMNYSIADLRNELTKERDADTITIVNPPVFKNGYNKMFNFKGHITWDSGITEFDFKSEYENLYRATEKLPTPFIWYRFRDVKGYDEKQVIYCKEYDIDKRDYWLLTKPEILKDFKYRYTIEFMKDKGVQPYPAPLFRDSDVITENSTIKFVKVDEQICMYYRDLFAHRLGITGAEHYYLMLVDEKIYSVCGFHTATLFNMQSTRVFENFGFSVPLKNNPHANRLLMMMITCKEFGEVIKKTTSNVNRLYHLKGLRTTCISKYRSIKTHRDILKRESREQIPAGQPNAGLYKIVADSDFHDHTFKETLAWFLKEQREQGHLKDNEEEK